MRPRFLVIVFLILMAVTFFLLYNSGGYGEESPGILEKIEKVFEKQQEINTKLKEVENLLHQIKIRVYRKTGF